MLAGNDNPIRPGTRPHDDQQRSYCKRKQAATAIVKGWLELIRVVKELIDGPAIDDQQDPDHRDGHCLLLVRGDGDSVEQVVEDEGEDGGGGVDGIVDR